MPGEAPNEKDGQFLRRLIIFIFIILTIAGALMTIFYKMPAVKK